MSLPGGTRLGPYEIVGPLGAGGMGVVYRARDTNLARDVALKTLPDSLADDAERLARFRREAQLLAALNHPHIGSIYGLEDAGGQRFLVLELVEGETLAARIERGPLPPGEAIGIAREIAEALEAAHAAGIVHRDLKPANIALTPNDRVKVLDFGLAKATAAASGSMDPLNSPTISSPAMLTGMGMILGTAAYMSPEQARGRLADKRSDVWAFGCVLYEMFTGRRAFEGDDVSDTLASVLKEEPDWKALPASVPPAVRALLAGCLEKNPRERIGDLSAALFVLKGTAHATVQMPSTPSARRSLAIGVLVALAGIAVGAAAVAFWPQTAPPVPPVIRFRIPAPENSRFTVPRRAVTVSPDGTRVVYVADARLYMRTLADNESRQLAGADSALQPTFSPDGESVLFWADSALRRISVGGGVPVTICQTAPTPLGVDWTREGIVFVQPGVGIMRVPATGGTPTLLVKSDGTDGLAFSPQLLPDGDTLIYSFAAVPMSPSARFWDQAQVMVHSARTGTTKTILRDGSDARYIPTGHLAYMVEGTMMAVPFDLQRLEVTGGAVPVVEGIRRSAPGVGAAAQFALSSTGTLVYIPGPARAGRDEVFLFNREGEATSLKLPAGSYQYPRVSPDGKWVALETNDGKQTSIALYDLSGRSSVRRLTFGGNDRLPIWSSDGRHVAFQSDREGDRSIYWQSVSGGVPERLTHAEAGTSHVPESWQPRGDVFLYSATKGTETSLWMFSLEDRKASKFGEVTSPNLPTNATFSPDGKWVAYQVGNEGIAEATLYVQPFPATGTKYEIGGGGRPMWSHDGRELLFVPGPSLFAVVSIETQPTFRFTPPTRIARRFGLAPPMIPRPYDMLPDGRMVAVDSAVDAAESQSPALQVVLNWFEELKAKVPSGR